MTALIDTPPREQHPRDRLLQHGSHALTEREALALVLGTASGDAAPALDLADQLLRRFGSLRGIQRAHPEDVARLTSVGPNAAAAIAGAFQLCRLAALPPDDAVLIRGPEDIAAVGWPRLSGLRREHALLIVCDARPRVRHVEVVGVGGINQTPMPIREILNCVLRHDGRGFAVAHNHPSGNARPSDPDVECSIELKAGADAVGLDFLGQVVVTDDEWQSVETELRPYHHRWLLRTGRSEPSGSSDWPSWTRVTVRRPRPDALGFPALSGRFPSHAKPT
jgi:DNA repair protein RadC